jgi:DNA-binding XRE family transcriptional regulator
MKTQDFEVDRGDSLLIFRAVHVDFRIQVSTRMPRRGRRALLLLIFRALKPVLPLIRNGCATHFDSSAGATHKDFTRKLSERQAPRIHPGTILRLQRLQRGWTQEKVAQKAEMSERTLRSIELGLSVPRPETLARIHQALGEAQEGIKLDATA